MRPFSVAAERRLSDDKPLSLQRFTTINLFRRIRLRRKGGIEAKARMAGSNRGPSDHPRSSDAFVPWCQGSDLKARLPHARCLDPLGLSNRQKGLASRRLRSSCSFRTAAAQELLVLQGDCNPLLNLHGGCRIPARNARPPHASARCARSSQGFSRPTPMNGVPCSFRTEMSCRMRESCSLRTVLARLHSLCTAAPEFSCMFPAKRVFPPRFPCRHAATVHLEQPDGRTPRRKNITGPCAALR